MVDIPNNTGTTATLSFGGSFSGDIETVGDEDWVAVTLQAGTTYAIQMLGASVGQGSLVDPFIKGLYSASGTSLDRADDDGAGGRNSQLVFTPDASGTYYVSAGGWESETGTYTMTLQEYEADTPTVTSRAVVEQVGLSGDDAVDSLLTLFGYQNVEGADTTHITFSIPGAGSLWSTEDGSGYGAEDGDGEPWNDITYLTTAEQVLFRDALEQVESFAAVTFDEVEETGNAAGTIRIAWTGLPDETAAAWAYTPSGSAKAGDIWLVSENQSTGGVGSYFHSVLLHELGHALGLKHPFDDDGSGVLLSSQYDGNDYTVMSYNTIAGNENIVGASLSPTTFMYLDILALQHIYGAIETEAGNTTYGFLSGSQYYETIWDTGGTDTYNASGISIGLTLDLTPGSWSDVGTTITLYGSSRNFTQTYTVYTPPEVVIENAVGGAGADRLVGNDADNQLTGGGGADSFVFSPDWGDDVITDFRVGTDRIDLSDTSSTFSSLSISGSSNAVIADNSGNTITLMGVSAASLTAGSFIDGQADAAAATPSADTLAGTSGADVVDALAGDDLVRAGDGNDNVTGGAGADSIYGDAGNDFLRGGDGNDAVAAGDGNDDIYAAGDGDDTMRGDDGNDVIGGGSGDDILIGDGTDAQVFSFSTLGARGGNILFGGTGDDTLVGSSWDDDGDGLVETGEIVTSASDGNHTIWAGDGDDLVFGGGAGDILGGGVGSDAVYAGAGNDVVFGGKGAAGVSADTVDGGSGNDEVYGGAGDDVIDGSSGNDALYGGTDDDVISAGSGNDEIYGGTGDDTLSGGTGSDQFYFASGHGDDVVEDFSVVIDTLGLANTTTDFTSAADVTGAASSAAVGGESGVMINTGGGDSIFLVGLSLSDLAAVDYVF
ncbi:M10 family metallopeptidase [Kordiimonas sp.]|uniref:M10 family metallopeptidase n=1 Tax=Kordiimonas sp. TaxID=1970157 RepID=UPI003A94575A